MVQPAGRLASVVKLGLLALWAVLGTAAWAAPINDNFSAATVLTGDYGTVTGDSTGATVEAGEPSHAGLPPRATVWYAWTANYDGPVEFDTFNSAIDTVLAVYTGNTLANFDFLVANDDVNPGGVQSLSATGTYTGPSGVKFNAKRGTTYRIAVGSKGVAGRYTLSWAYHSSGVFRFSADGYTYSRTESDGSVNTTTSWSPQGARITVTRLFGATGRVTANFDVIDGTGKLGTDYRKPFQTSVVFDNNEMSKSFIVPIVDTGSIGAGGRNPGRCNVGDPVEPNFHVLLTSVALDPWEDPTVVSLPRIEAAHSNSVVTVEPFDIDSDSVDPANPTLIGSCGTTNGVANFEHCVFRTIEGVGTVRVAVYRVGGAPDCEIHYVIDSTGNNPSNTRLNTFDLQAGSDYAAPTLGTDGPSSLNADFEFPTTDSGGYAPPAYGTLSWGGGDRSPKYIQIPINDDTLPEFNEDIRLRLFRIPNHSTDLMPGYVSQSTLTILYDDYPAGALDDAHNRDFSLATDPPRNSMPGADNTVYALAVQPDNKTIIAGNFGTYNTVPRFGIARINDDGSIDSTFDPGDGVPVKDFVNPSYITCLALLPNNQMVIGGNFPSFNGTERNNVAQLNADGSLDTAFNPGLGPNGTVWSVALQPNGQVLIGGEFTKVNGYLRSHIARLNADGTLDPSFDPGTNGPNGNVYAITVKPDGSIYIGGQFTTVNSQSRHSVALLTTNGVVASSFAPVVGADGPIYALALQPDGKLVIGGTFDNVELRSRSNIARYNPDGTLDLSFDPGTGADDTIYTLLLQADNRILLGGLFTSVNETHRMGLARLFPSGEVDTSFMDTAYNQFAGLHKPIFNPYVDPKDYLLTMGLQNDGKLMIGGSFHYVGGGRWTSEVRTNDVGPIDTISGVGDSGETRATYRNRANVARLLGGETTGPGSIGLVATNYNIGENQGFLFVKLVRTNGTLGQIESTFSIPNRVGTNGIGVAQSGVDYIYNRVNPFFDNSWGQVFTRAVSDGLYGTNNGTFTVIPGMRVNTTLDDVYVTIKDIQDFQGDRTAPFKLDMPSFADAFFLGGEDIPLGSALARTAASLRITETDTRPGVVGFSSTNYFVNENATNAYITLVRTDGSVGTIAVTFATTNGNAVAGTDYTGVTNTVSFFQGQTTATIAVPIRNDATSQSADRTVKLYLTALTGQVGDLKQATLYIIDDDFLPGRLNFTSTTYSTNELSPAMIVTVTRTGGNVGVLDVQYASSNLTATAANYVPVIGSLHWDNGDTSPRYISVPLLHDGLVTGDRQFALTLFNPSIAGAIGGRLQATCTILNKDAYGKLQFSAGNYNVNESGGYATITVTRVGGSAETESAAFSTVDGNAQQFLNYLPTNGVLTFSPGEISKSFTVRIVDDLVANGPNLFFNVQLSSFSPAGSGGSPIAATVQIYDSWTYTQPPGQVDTYFNPDAGFNGDVLALALQPDGRIVAGGAFTTANGLPVNRLTRLYTDGSLDQTFLTTLGGANGDVRALINQTDSRILVGGAFSTLNGIVRNGLGRLNYDGTIDTSFNPGSGADSTVFAVAETFDAAGPRKILVGGSFNSFSGAHLPGLVRLNDDGTLDTGFNTGIGVNGTVYAVAVYPTNSPWAGHVVIGGDFTAVNGTARNRIARLKPDGTVDLTFDVAAGANDTVRALALQSDGKVLLGGTFTAINLVNLSRVARLNSDGSVDTSFQSGLGANDAVYAVVLQPDNRILLGGEFTRASGVTRNRLTRLMPDGKVDPTINFGTGANNFVSAILVQPDNKIVIGGGFTEVQGLARAHLARIYGGSVTGSGDFKFDAPVYVAEENSTNLLVTIIRSGGTSGPLPDGSGEITVDCATSNGSALAGINYSNVNLTLHFPVGETMEIVRVPLIDDLQITPDLTFNLALNNPLPPALLGPQPTAVVTLANMESTVSFSSATYSRNEDAVDGAASILLLRSGSTRTAVSVDFMTTTDGSAIPDYNYTPVTNTVVFLQGQTEQIVKIPLLHTPASEGDRTVTMELSNPSGTLLLAPYTATLTVVDVDKAPGEFIFSQTNYVVSEGAGNALITVVRTNGRAGVVSVGFSTVPGSATPGLKYISTNGIVSFADGELSKSFLVRILEESQVEGAQTVGLLLSNPTGGASVLETNAVSLTIMDDDIGYSFSGYVYIGSETNDLIMLDVLRLNSTNGTTHVSYATTNGTAVAGLNYSAVSGTLTFIPGETRKSISVPLKRDPRVTGDLTFAVNLSNPDGGAQLAVPSSANVVVLDVDSGLRFQDARNLGNLVVTNSVSESGGSIVVTVTRTNANTGPVQVNYTTADDTAQAPWDYISASGVLTFTNGQLSSSFTIPIVDNTRVDGDRSFTVSLFNPTAPAQLLNPSVNRIIIVDNDSGFRFSSDSYEVMENGASVPVTITRNGSTNSLVTLTFSTQDGSAKAGVDYVATNCVLTFTNGELSKTLSVEVRDDTLLQGDRAFNVQLSQPSGNGVLVTPSAATITIHDNDGSLVVPAGVALTAESLTPADGVIQPGETVSMLFAFRDAAGSNTVNLVATLLPTNGIASPSAPQTYGALAVEGPSVSRPFTFTANATNGQRITATFLLQDGGRTVGTNAGLAVFSFTVGTSTAAFTNTALITINDATNNIMGATVPVPASPYPAFIEVRGVDGVISKVSLTLSNVNHSSPSDMDALLVSPTAKAMLLMANAGGNFALSKATLTFDDAATATLPQFSAIASGTYKPTAYQPVANFPTPAPPASPAPYATSLSAFNGGNPNGRWNLFLIDDTVFDAGAISNGWKLDFTLVNPVLGAADLGLYMSADSSAVVLGSNITYTLCVTNYGPGAATAVQVTNTFPAGTAFVSASPSQGTAVTNGAGQLVWSVGAMAKDGVATLSLKVQALTPGTLTNSALVAAASSDLNPEEDTASVVTSVITPSADLALGMAGAPNPVLMGHSLTYTLTISNQGPGTAVGVALTDILPPGVRFLSATPASYYLNGSSVSFTNLGALPSGAALTANITVQAAAVGTLTNYASCASLITDPLKLNNSVAIKTVVSAVPLALSLSGDSLTLAWPSEAETYILESATNLIAPVIWTEVVDPAPRVLNGQKILTLPIDSSSRGTFFRLRATAP